MTLHHSLTTPDQDAWEPWRPAELARRLDGISRPWCIVGGWALDLWHDRQTRAHEDLEFTVLRDDLDAFRRQLTDIECYAVHDGALERLSADQAPGQDVFQVWGFDRNIGCWRVDMMVEPGTDDVWVCKRDPGIRRPRAESVGWTADGIPYLNPAAVLLFKAKYCRPKDEKDFAIALPALAAPDRRWLRECLDRLHPGHAWLAALQE